MSIVERAAARLGVVPKPQATPTPESYGKAQREAQEPASRSREPSLFERAAAGHAGRAEVANEDSIGNTVQNAGPQLAPKAPPPARVNPRVLEIDQAWLISHNIIAPGTERTPMEDGFRRIKRHILTNVYNPPETAKPDDVPNLVMITSALPHEGKTFCSVNLAISIAMELDHTVLLVDCDTVRPSVLPALGLKRDLPGLMDVLANRRIGVDDVLHRTNIEKLSILPAGTPHRYATEMLASETMHALVRELAERYDDRIVIFDSPPLLVTSESAVLATHMSQVVLVVAAGQTTESAVSDALRRLEGCRQVGLLLNKGQDTGTGYGYGYGYGYG